MDNNVYIEVDDRLDREYSLVLYNSKYQREERYMTKAKDEFQLWQGLSVFIEGGMFPVSIEDGSGRVFGWHDSKECKEGGYN